MQQDEQTFSSREELEKSLAGLCVPFLRLAGAHAQAAFSPARCYLLGSLTLGFHLELPIGRLMT